MAKAKGKTVRTGNYSEFEDVILIKAWEEVLMDAVTGTNQTGKRHYKKNYTNLRVESHRRLSTTFFLNGCR
jgi:hypothetical protein